MKSAAIIVAAGRGERAGEGPPKQYRPLLGKPVLAWSVEACVAAGVDDIVVAISPDHYNFAQQIVAGRARLVEGAATRTGSVSAALSTLSPDIEVVLVHDAARPGLRAETLRLLIDAIVNGADAVAPVLPVVDALRRASGGRAGAAVDRAELMRVQTPQAFRGALIRAAYTALDAAADFADDISVVETMGADIRLVPGDQRLMKITYPEDFVMLEHMMGGERVICVGHGVDAHRFGAGDHVTLCGVRIEHDKGLLGHSDADAGWHALVDAILGALGEGDIGAHFPPGDPRWKGAGSDRFLRHARALADAQGACITHVDITIICERPKIGPHREAMRAHTSEVLGLPLSRVSVKATTTERMGFLGREEGLAAQATATVERRA